MLNCTRVGASALLCWGLCVGCAAEDGDDGTATLGASTGMDASTAGTSASSDGTTSGTSSTTSGGTTDATTSTSTTGSDPTTEGDGGSSSGGSGSGVTVTGNISRSVDPGGSNDGIGDAWLGLLASCAQDGERVGGTTVYDADLSGDGAIVPFTLEDVPDGTWYLTGFFDDNQNTDPMDPGPDLNDLASAEGLGPKCTEIVVAGSDVSGVVLTFNFVVPF